VETAPALAAARALLERTGLLLFSDPALPSLVGIIVGEPLRTSWWGHPRGGDIYHAMNELEDDPEVLSTKLVAGKVTYVHKRLWPAIYAIGQAREAWQIESLSPGAAFLLGAVEAEDALQTDDVFAPPDVLPRRRVPDATRELERRLLVHATEVHTPSGAHAKVLETWPRWADSVDLTARGLGSAEARRQLEQAAERLTAEVSGGVAVLPWQPSRRRAR